MSAANSTDATGDNQIDLVGIWSILSRRRLLILGAVLLAIVVALAYVFVKAPVFESRAKIEVGQVSAGENSMAFESPELLASRVLARYGPIAPDGSRRPRPYLVQASAQNGVSAVVELVAQGDARQDAAELLETLYREVSVAHQEIYESNVGALTQRLKQLDYQRETLSGHVEEVSRLLESLKERDPVQASLLMLERGRVLMTLGDLEAKRPDVVQKLAAPQSRPTRLLNEIAAAAAPSEPRVGAAFVLAIVVGSVVGILIAFFLEFLAYARSAGVR